MTTEQNTAPTIVATEAVPLVSSMAWISHLKNPVRWLLFLGGITLTGASVAIVVRSNLGVSVLASVPYMLSLSIPIVSLGTWNYIVQGLLMILLIPILKTFKPVWIFSFAVSVFFGLTIDMFTLLCQFLPLETLGHRLLYFGVGFLLLTIGVPMSIKSGFPILPFDVFVKEIACFRGKAFRPVKTGFDLIFLAISISLMVLVLQRFVGIGAGTVFSAIANGTAMQFWLRRLDKWIPENPV